MNNQLVNYTSKPRENSQVHLLSDEVLAELSGYSGSLHTFTQTHWFLTVEVLPLDRSREANFRYLRFAQCRNISAPTNWRFVKPTIVRLAENLVRFKDERIEIICELVYLASRGNR